ncbi:vitamin B12 independent methionine synthase [Lentilactobacillus buchneri]|uniref:vitamin B12 independent methionine synthase n=1 Tax=Lentilactobacillus buchneri TaxID=1581 RepID=UPI0021A79C4F|nr:vitamin B12 independent methionine synthase [Lentilactobacillus buchneri]MCT3545861.1 vitamin B12 independent methionine synthase [Lentilactobacillus buchneri]
MTNIAITTKFPYRYDVVGSLLRTQALKDAHAKYHAGQISTADLQKVQHAETKKIVDKQVELGLKDITDGEFNRSWWHLDFLWGLTGVQKYDYHKSYKFHGSKTRTDNAELSGKVAFNPDHPFFDSFKFLQSITPDGVTPKQTIPSPTMLFRDNRSDNWSKFYDTWDQYLTDVAKVYHETILHFYELGARYVQLDDTTWAFLISKLNETADDAAAHAKYVKLAEDSVKVINQLLTGLPNDLTVTTHICRGNFKSTFLFSGGYDDVAEYLGQLNYDGLFLEYDSEQAGDFSPLGKIWNGDKNKRIVLGLITSKSPELEDKDAVINRIHQVSGQVPLENLALSTQCGFASTEKGNKLTEQQQWAKLKLVRDIAREVWDVD